MLTPHTGRTRYLAVLQALQALSALVRAAIWRALRISDVVGATARTAGGCAGRAAIPCMPARDRARPSSHGFDLGFRATRDLSASGASGSILSIAG